jgi:hypothetical protein
VADQSSAEKLTCASKSQKSKNYKGKIGGRLFWRAAKNEPWHLGPSSFFLNYVMDIHEKSDSFGTHLLSKSKRNLANSEG